MKCSMLASSGSLSSSPWAQVDGIHPNISDWSFYSRVVTINPFLPDKFEGGLLKIGSPRGLREMFVFADFLIQMIE